MIWNSQPWKKDIWKAARYFERLQTQHRHLSASQRISIEKQVFFSFYAIRKLIEARKLSDECTSQQIQVTTYPYTGKPITHFNWHKFDEHFNFNHPQKHTWTVLTLCHQFVHSYIFQIISGETGGLAGFMIASERQKKSGLLQIEVETVMSLFDSITKDDIISSFWTRDPNTGKETFILSNRPHNDTKVCV